MTNIFSHVHKCILTALLFLPLTVSCDLLRDTPFEIEDWSPGGGYHRDFASLEISLLFSRNCDRVRVEQAFSLLEDGRSVKGYFSWKGRHLVFLPAVPLEENRDYLISLGTGAQDTEGLSLERKFEAAFSTRPEGGRLAVVSVFPFYDGIITEPRQSVDVFFSGEVTVNSCINHISFSPSLNGSWRLFDGGKTAKFIPFDPWRQGSKYRISIAPGFKDLKNRSLGVDFSSSFTVAIGGDGVKPEFKGAWAVKSGIEETEIKEKELFDEWESFTALRLDFSKPVDAESVKNRLSVEPHAALHMETHPGFVSSVFFRFAENPEWNKRFLFRLGSGIKDSSGNESEEERIFSIRTNGRFSKPPALAGIRLPMRPKSIDEAEMKILSFCTEDIFEDLPIEAGEECYPYAVPVSTWIELYFDTAPETEIDPFSLMDLFRVEATNGAINFSPRLVTKNFTRPEPLPKWESYKRIEVQGFLTNTVNSGIVSFVIPQGLLDLRGNKSQKVFRISLLK